MKTAQLAEVCDITMGQAPSGETYNDTGVGLPLVAGAGDFGDLYPVPKKYTTARNVRTSQPGDIIVGIRASIGGKVWADGTYCLGRGVAGLRARADLLDQKYLWHWVTHSSDRLAAKGRGATFLQVNKQDVAEMEILLPPIEEQRRIAAALDAADALRAKRRQALAKLDTLTESIFHNMFGWAAATEYPVVPLNDLIDDGRPICYGILKPGPDLKDGHPYVRVVDMKDGGIDPHGVRRTSAEISHQYRRSLLRSGDLLMSIRGHVGRLAEVPPELDGANITQDSARIGVAGANPRYVLAYLRTADAQRWMARNTKGVAVRGLNISDLRRLPIVQPPREEQDTFVDSARAVDRVGAETRGSQAQLDNLFASLQQRAFRGEL
jgi:type I restriction enzyme S subunit